MKKSFFATPPSKSVQLLSKLTRMIFRPSHTEMTEQNFLTTSEKKSYDVVNNKVDPKLVHRLYLGQTLINWNETWYASSTPWSEDPSQSWEQRHLWVVRYQKFTFSLITFENVVQMFLLLCPFILGLENQLYSATTSSKIQHWNGNNSWTPDSRKMKLSTPDYSLHADHIQ